MSCSMSKDGLSESAAFPFGRVVKPHGTKGLLKIRPFFKGSEALLGAKVLLLVDHDNEQETSYTVRAARKDRFFFLLELEGVSSRDQAEKLRGLEVRLFLEEGELEASSFPVVDCMGFEARDQDKRVLGRIEAVLDNPAHPLLLILSSDGKEVLVPWVREFVSELDSSRKLVLLSLPDGLVESQS